VPSVPKRECWCPRRFWLNHAVECPPVGPQRAPSWCPADGARSPGATPSAPLGLLTRPVRGRARGDGAQRVRSDGAPAAKVPLIKIFQGSVEGTEALHRADDGALLPRAASGSRADPVGPLGTPRQRLQKKGRRALAVPKESHRSCPDGNEPLISSFEGSVTGLRSDSAARSWCPRMGGGRDLFWESKGIGENSTGGVESAMPKGTRPRCLWRKCLLSGYFWGSKYKRPVPREALPGQPPRW
jgi:hypothetical protein